MATINNILGVIPAPVALVLMLGGFIFYALGCVRLGYGAAVKPMVLDLIERAEQEIQGTKRGAERKAWVVKDASRRPEYQQIRQAHQLGNHRRDHRHRYSVFL